MSGQIILAASIKHSKATLSKKKKKKTLNGPSCLNRYVSWKVQARQREERTEREPDMEKSDAHMHGQNSSARLSIF